MPVYLPPSPTAENFADAVKELLTPIATKMSGRDLRITDNEARNGVPLHRVTVEEHELASDTIRRQLASSGVNRASVNSTMEGIGRRALRAGKRATGGDGRISTDNAAGLPRDLQKIFMHLRGQNLDVTLPAGRVFVGRLQDAIDGLARWHESGDNGVDPRILHFADAASVQAALDAVLGVASDGNGGRLLEEEGQAAIDRFRISAAESLETWRATFYDGNPVPAADENTEAMAVFGDAVNATFGELAEVRAARGNNGEDYLIGRVQDGYVAAVIWPYRDG